MVKKSNQRLQRRRWKNDARRQKARREREHRKKLLRNEQPFNISTIEWTSPSWATSPKPREPVVCVGGSENATHTVERHFALTHAIAPRCLVIVGEENLHKEYFSDMDVMSHLREIVQKEDIPPRPPIITGGLLSSDT